MNNEERAILSQDSLTFNREKKQIYFDKFTHTKYENYLSAAPLRFESLNLDLLLTEQTK